MWTVNWVYRQAAQVLAQGPVPKHIAFIMDGNRRYARSQNKSTLRGHEQGYSKLKEALQWCLAMGIRDVTVFAFSIENFNRSKQEVEGLMQLAAEKFTEMLENGDIITQHNARVRVLGSSELIPQGVRDVMRNVVEVSRDNTRVNLNICFSYSHEQEMQDAVDSIAAGLDAKQLLPCDVSPDLMQACMYTGANPVDMLIRTSGEARLSDFLLYQSSNAYVRFLRAYWPDLGFWRFGLMVLEYQRAYKELSRRREEQRVQEHRQQLVRDLEFLTDSDAREERRRSRLQSTDDSSESKPRSSSSSSSSSPPSSSDELDDGGTDNLHDSSRNRRSSFCSSSSSSGNRFSALRHRKRKPQTTTITTTVKHSSPSSPLSPSKHAPLEERERLLRELPAETADRLKQLASERAVRVAQFLLNRTRTGIMD